MTAGHSSPDPRLAVLGVLDPWIVRYCECLRRNCAHKREQAAARARYDQLAALTPADVDWLLAMGWRP